MSASRGHRPHAARSILSNWATFVFSAGVNFVVSPIVVGSLGQTEYGAWALLVSLVGYLGLLDLGVRGAVTRYVAASYAARDHARANQIYAAALRIFSAGAVLAVAIACVMAVLVGRVFHIPPELISVARVVAVIGGLNVAVSILSGVFGGVVIGLERFDYNNAFEIAIGALRAIAVVSALRMGQGLVALALIQLAAALIRGAANVVLVRRLYPELDLTAVSWNSEFVRLIVTFGITSTLLHVSSSLMLYSDSLVIGALMPVGAITFFAIAGNLSEYARAVVSGISQTVTPRVGALQAQGDHRGVETAILFSARLASLVMLPIATTFMFRGGSFIGLWMGPAYADLAGRVLLILSISLLTIGGYQVTAVAMIGLNKHSALIPIFVAEAVTNLALSILWVNMYGVVGSAMGTMVPRVIMGGFVLPWYMGRVAGLKLRSFWTTVFIRPMIAILPFAAATYAIEHLAPAHDLVVFFAQVMLVLPLAAIPMWLLCLDANDKLLVRRAIGRLTPRTRTSAPPVMPIDGGIDAPGEAPPR